MQPSETISIIVSVLSFLVSSFVAYRTLLWRFVGKVWHANAIVLTHVDGIPSIGIACFAENKGAQPGYLEDMRLEVVHIQTGSIYRFYPILVRDDYNIFESYAEPEWYPFSGFYLMPRDNISKYVLFKPQNDHFVAGWGDYKIQMQVRWRDRNAWEPLSSTINIEINTEIASQWNNSDAPVYQVFSVQVLSHRNLFGG